MTQARASRVEPAVAIPEAAAPGVTGIGAAIDRELSPVAVVAATSGLGLLIIGLADLASRQSLDGALPLFWLGIVTLFGPASWRLVVPLRRVRAENGLVRRGASRPERLAIVLLLGLAVYVVKVMTSPTGFNLPDEFSHLRTLEDILRTGHLFAENPLLQVSSIYPGLEATAATAQVSTGLAAFPIGIVVIGVGRVLSTLALFLLAERVTRSARVAGIASVIYMANPSYLLFDSQFAYESLALPLAIVAIWAVLSWTEHRSSRLYPAIALVSIAATSVTHHVTSLALLAFLVTWTIVAFLADRFVLRRPRGDHQIVALAAAVAFAASATWLAVAGTAAFSYLTPVVGYGVTQLLSVLFGGGEAKHLFGAQAGFGAPLPEIVVGYLGVALLVFSLPAVLLHAVRGHRPPAIVLVLCGVAVLYPPTLALRFTVAGSEISQRASEFVFVGVAILTADWLAGTRWTAWRLRRFGVGTIVAALLLVVAAGMVVGEPPVSRLPGPYHVAAEQRSIEPEGEATALWAVLDLGPDNRLIADRTNAKLLGSLGLQFPVTAANSHLGTAYVMYGVTVNQDLLNVLRAGGIEYVVVDLRLSRDVPIYSYLFEQAEPDAGNHTTPMPLADLQKWDSLPGVQRIYDSGDILIYDVRGLDGAS